MSELFDTIWTTKNWQCTEKNKTKHNPVEEDACVLITARLQD